MFQLRTPITERGLAVHSRLPEAVVQASPPYVEIVLRNLVENAIKYAVPNTALTLRLIPAPGGWCFESYNACPDSLDVRPEQLFEPFFRPDASRSSSTGGNGLGLAICRAVAEVSAWSLDWKREAHGVRVRVGFPASPEVAPAALPPAEEAVPCSESVPASH